MLRRNKLARAKIDRKWSMHYISGVCKKWHQSIYNYTCIHKGFETIICRCLQHLPVKFGILKNKTNACAFCFCLGFPRPFISDTSPKQIHREGLGESRAGTRQTLSKRTGLINAMRMSMTSRSSENFASVMAICEVRDGGRAP